MKHNALLIAGLTLSLLAGCSSKSKTPFADLPANSPALLPPANPDDPSAPLPDQASASTSTPTPTSTPASDAPTLVISVDEHGNMTRNFPVSVLPEQPRGIVAGPLYWPDLNRAQKRSDLQNFLFEPVEIVLSSAMLPLRAIATPPWKRVIYTPVPADDTTPASAYDHQIITTEQLEK